MVRRAPSFAARGSRGHSDQAVGVSRKAAARSWPQSWHIMLSAAGSATGHRIEGVLAALGLDHKTCSVSRVQPEQ
jgi:hypothetical protein